MCGLPGDEEYLDVGGRGPGRLSSRRERRQKRARWLAVVVVTETATGGRGDEVVTVLATEEEAAVVVAETARVAEATPRWPPCDNVPPDLQPRTIILTFIR